MEKDVRNIRLLVNKPGGTASKNSLSYRCTIPTKWVAAMGLDAENRDIVATFDGEKIIIAKVQQ